MKNNLRKITYTSVFTAIICVLTLFTHIPLPLANARYVHLGDAAIFVAGILCGGLPAAFAAGVGSSLADIFSGAAVWALPTLIIKSLMGFVIGYFANHEEYICIRNFVMMFLAGLIMAVGYFLTEVFVFGLSPYVVIFGVHFYFIQFGSGMAVAAIVLLPLKNFRQRLPFNK